MLPAKELLVLTVLGQLMDKFNKHYLWISQEKFLELLEKFHDYGIQRRMLCYRLAALERQGFIKRTKRHSRNKMGEFEGKTSIVTITRQGFIHLARAARAVAKALNKSLIAFLFKKPQHQKEERQPPRDATAAKHNLAMLLKYLENPDCTPERSTA
jgi:hypothetical protein